MGRDLMRTLVIRRIPDENYQALKEMGTMGDESMEGFARFLILQLTNTYLENKSVIVAADISGVDNGEQTTP